MTLPFEKLAGAGNDFVLVEASRLRRGASRAALARRLCSKRTGIGADGLLVVAAGRKPSVDYYNADGSRAFCANGTRCAAWWLHARGGGAARFTLGTSRGPVEAAIGTRGRVRVRMPSAGGFRLGLRLAAAGRTWTVHAADTGVPHAVVEVPRLEGFPVVEVGRALRRHRAFGAPGANVNFVARGANGLAVRTYERGVEDETLACGTGAVAAALVAHLLHGSRPPVRLRTRGGDTLEVRFLAPSRASPPKKIDEIWLEGPAVRLFRGEVDL